MADENKIRLAITEVVAETTNGEVHVALSSRQLSKRQRNNLAKRPAKRTKYLLSPCKINISLKVEEFDQKVPKRSEAWLYVGNAQPAEKTLRFIHELDSVEVNLKEPIILCCVVDATPHPSVTWFKNGTVLAEERCKRTVTDNSEIQLQIDESCPEDAGDYTVCISNECGGIESSANVLVVYERPTFVRPLKDLEVSFNCTASLTCTVRGSPEPTVVWLASGVEIRPSKKHSMSKDGDVATLILRGIQLEDTKGLYSCKAKNDVGEAETQARLVPRDPPKFVVPIVAVCGKLESPAKFYCKATGWPPPILSWALNGSKVDRSKEHVINTENGADGSESLLTVNGIRPETVGKYSVKAENRYGEDHCNATLSIALEPPVFVETFHDKTLVENDILKLSARVTGVPPPDIKWMRDDVALENVSNCLIEKDGEICRLVLEDIQLSMAGKYKCLAENEAGKAVCTARITVKEQQRAPVFTKHLQDCQATENDRICLECSAHGKPTPDVTWFKNELELKDGDSRYQLSSKKEGDSVTVGLTLVSSELGDTGDIKAVAKNPAGVALSVARLLVTVRSQPPLILKPPADQELTEGDDCCFEAVVSGRPRPSVKWVTSDVELKSSERIKFESDEETHRLLIKEVQLSESGPFTIRAANSAGETTATAQLTVNEKPFPPVFVIKLQNLEVLEGDIGQFNCTVTGKPLPTIKWIKNNEELKSFDGIKTDETGNRNELTTSLTLNQLSLTDNGEIKVIARNIAGENYCLAMINVRMRVLKPEFLKGPIDVEITENEDCYFSAVTAGKPLPEVQWFRDNIPLKSSNRIVLENLDNTSTVTLTNAELSDAGVFTIKAKNIGGEVTATANLIVHEKLWPPVFTKELADQTVVEDDDASFDCEVNGKPLPILTCFRNGKELRDGGRIKFTTTKDANHVRFSCLFNKIAMEDNAEIKVVATNPVGESQSSSKLDVKMRVLKPEFLKGPIDVEITENEDCYFSAVTAGKPLPDIQWFKNDILLGSSDRVALGQDGGRTSLTITNAELLDAGLYTVTAKNIGGEVSRTAKLTVNEKLWPPVFTKPLSAKSSNEGDPMNLNCTVTGKPLPQVTWSLNKRAIQDLSRVQFLNAEDGDELNVSIMFDSVLSEDQGDLEVRATNSVGEATSSARLVINKKPWFVESLKNLEIMEDEDCCFEAVVDGRPSPEIQWFYEGNLQRSSDLIMTISEGTRHKLILKKRSLQDCGEILITALNCAGETSSRANLVVKEKTFAPEFTERLINQTLVEEDRLVARCSVTGKPRPSCVWFLDGREIKDSNRYNIESVDSRNFELNLSLMIPSVGLNDSAVIEVVARNPVGEATTSAKLIVNEKVVKPVILERPVDQEIQEGGSCSFDAIVSGKPEPDVEWFKDGVGVKPSERIIYSSQTLHHHRLTINDARPSDGAVYRIRAKNLAGEAEAEAKLIVNPTEAYFVEMLEDVSVNEGMPATFSCRVFPKTAPVTWLVDGEEISPSDPKYQITSKDDERTLEIVRSLRGDSGKYTVLVGELQSYATLTVEASETEVVESRLLYEIHEDMFMSVAAEFLCTRGAGDETILYQSSDNPDQVVTEQVQSASKRRWVVKKAYISREGDNRVDKWSVKSYVDYTCSAESISDISRGVFNDVMFSVQTVEFVILLKGPCMESKWLKDGRHILDSTKHHMSIEDGGLLHMLTVNDVQPKDQGIYTFKVTKSSSTTQCKFEASANSAPILPSDSTAMTRSDYDASVLMSRVYDEVDGRLSQSHDTFSNPKRYSRSPSKDFVHKQLLDFDADLRKDDAEKSWNDGDLNNNDDDVFSDVSSLDGSVRSLQEKPTRRSLIFSETSIPLPGRLLRASSLPSVFSPNKKSCQVLYFSYAESTQPLSF